MTPWIRATLERKIVSGARHALAILFALIAVACGVLVLVLTKAATTPAIVAGVGLIVLGMLIAIPAQMKTARYEVTRIWKSYRAPQPPSPGGGTP